MYLMLSLSHEVVKDNQMKIQFKIANLKRVELVRTIQLDAGTLT